MKPADEELPILARVVAEIVHRRREGERPDLAEYRRQYPRLADEIEEQVRIIEVLEGDRDLEGPPASRRSLGELLSRQPEAAQRLIVLRDFEKRPWREIAMIVRRPEDEIRKVHARLLWEILDSYCSTEPTPVPPAG